jgi:hypothetical protein
MLGLVLCTQFVVDIAVLIHLSLAVRNQVSGNQVSISFVLFNSSSTPGLGGVEKLITFAFSNTAAALAAGAAGVSRTLHAVSCFAAYGSVNQNQSPQHKRYLNCSLGRQMNALPLVVPMARAVSLPSTSLKAHRPNLHCAACSRLWAVFTSSEVFWPAQCICLLVARAYSVLKVMHTCVHVMLEITITFRNVS